MMHRRLWHRADVYQSRKGRLAQKARGSVPLFLNQEGTDGLDELGNLFVFHFVGIQEHGVTGRIHHRQYAKGGFGIDAELFGAQQDFLGEVLADGRQLFGGLHRVNMDVHFHFVTSPFAGIRPGSMNDCGLSFHGLIVSTGNQKINPGRMQQLSSGISAQWNKWY